MKQARSKILEYLKSKYNINDKDMFLRLNGKIFNKIVGKVINKK